MGRGLHNYLPPTSHQTVANQHGTTTRKRSVAQNKESCQRTGTSMMTASVPLSGVQLQTTSSGRKYKSGGRRAPPITISPTSPAAPIPLGTLPHVPRHRDEIFCPTHGLSPMDAKKNFDNLEHRSRNGWARFRRPCQTEQLVDLDATKHKWGSAVKPNASYSVHREETVENCRLNMQTRCGCVCGIHWSGAATQH
eukprot:3874019-Amphidinium_carterae.1